MTFRELTGRFLEEAIYRLERVAFDDQSFLLRPRLSLSTFRFLCFGHNLLLLSQFPSGVHCGVPQPGIEPGRPNWARGCKPRLTANSSTGGDCEKALNAGTVTPVKTSTVPAWFFRPFSAALLPFSCCLSFPKLGDNLEQLDCDVASLYNSRISQPITPTPAFSNDDNVSICGEPIKHSISAGDCKAASSGDALHDFRACNGIILAQNFLAIEQQQNGRFGRPWTCSQRYNALIKLHDFVQTLIYCGSFWLCCGIRIRCRCRNNNGGHRRPCLNQFLKRRELGLHDLYWAFGLKFICAQFDLQAIVVVHEKYLSPYLSVVSIHSTRCVKALNGRDFHKGRRL